MATYTYNIAGKKFRTQEPLTDAQLEELASSVQQEASPPPVTTYEAVGSQGQPIPGISTEVLPAEQPVTASNAPSAVTSSGFLMGLKDPISAGAQMLPRALAGITSLGGIVPNMFSSWLSSEAARVDAMVRAEEEQYRRLRAQRGEEGTDLARIAGNVLNPATLGIAGSVGRALPAMGVLGTGAATGATTGLFQPVTEGEFATEKAKQAAAGGLGGALGGAAVAGAGRMLNPLVSKAEQTMRDLGVALTPGQLIGGKAKSFEEFAQNLPLVGSYITDARQRAIYSFNKGVINKALNKVGEKLPEDVVGRDAVQYVDDIVTQRYNDVLSKVNFKLDNKAYLQIVQALRSKPLPSAEQNETVKQILNNEVYSKIPLGTQITGDAYQKIKSDLAKTSLRYANSSLASEREIGLTLGAVVESMKKTLALQNPTQTSALRRIDSAYGDISVMKTAAANSGAANGVFTPSQYNTAVRQRDASRRKTIFAAGKAKGQDISDAAIAVLEREAGSTLEGRLATQVGGGLAALSAPQISVPIALLSPALYSETGIKAMTVLMRSRPEMAKRIGEFLTSRATKEGSITGDQVMREYNRFSKAEE